MINYKRKLKTILYLFFILNSSLFYSKDINQNKFISTSEGHFVYKGKPYYFFGTNFWYGAILASKGEGGNRNRLKEELDFLKSIGINNLRILVGADGKNDVPSKVQPTLQILPNVYNDTILGGLDFLLMEMSKRKMFAVLYFNNSWEWSGGYSQYLEWAGYGNIPIPSIDGWMAYQKYVSQFQKSENAKAIFRKYVLDIITRTNRYTRVKYINDPTIMAWEIGNEPRPFGIDNVTNFVNWIDEISSIIKSTDNHHLITTGSEGYQGCEGDIKIWEQIHSFNNIDYCTIHIWPYNWGWAKKDSLKEMLDRSILQMDKYIQDHLIISSKLKKPLVIEEFGYPRDNFLFSIETPVDSRNKLFQYMGEKVINNKLYKGYIGGCNFWGWGGFVKRNEKNLFWKKGDEYTGDPAQEQQGLNSVFSSDNTTLIIKKINNHLRN